MQSHLCSDINFFPNLGSIVFSYVLFALPCVPFTVRMTVLVFNCRKDFPCGDSKNRSRSNPSGMLMTRMACSSHLFVTLDLTNLVAWLAFAKVSSRELKLSWKNSSTNDMPRKRFRLMARGLLLKNEMCSISDSFIFEGLIKDIR